MNTYEFVNIPAQVFPDREALCCEGRRHTYARLQQRILVWAAELRRRGLGPGKRLAVMDTNSDDYVELFYATGVLGATFIPLNYRAKRDELTYLLNTAQADFVCVGTQYAELSDSVRAGLPSLKHMILLDDETRQRIDGGTSADLEPVCVEDGELAVIMFTAGTTSKPKGVMLRYGDLTNYVIHSAEPVCEDECCTQLLVAPFYHIAGLTALMLAPYSGRRMVVERQFDAIDWLETVEQERITNAFLVPTMLKRLIEEPAFCNYDLSSLSVLSYGAAAMPPGVLLKALVLFPQSVGFINAYGQTETTATVAMLGPEDHRLEGTPEEIERKKARLRSIGKPVGDVELRIVDEEHRPLPAGQIGEVALRTERAMQGYLPQDGRVVDSARRDAEGWLYTSDLGWIDEEGYIFLAGRKSDLIIRGGENIAPEEVETVLYQHPAVEDVAVIGVPDEEWGEQVAAAVVLRPDGTGTVTAGELTDFCRERLASYKKPAHIRFVRELPRSPLGKVLKNVLRDEFQKTA